MGTARCLSVGLLTGFMAITADANWFQRAVAPAEYRRNEKRDEIRVVFREEISRSSFSNTVIEIVRDVAREEDKKQEDRLLRYLAMLAVGIFGKGAWSWNKVRQQIIKANGNSNGESK